MRAGVYRGRHDMRLEERPLPAVGAGEARLRVEACGVCGSDLHVYQAEPREVPLGMTLGHEFVGVIDEVGEGCRWSVGDRVAVEPLMSCGECEWCLAGRATACSGFSLVGMQRPGGFADHAVVPEHRLFRVPAELDPAVAALAEPVAVCVRGLNRGRLTEKDDVLVLGGGTIGLLTVAVARLRGAGRISVTARYPHQAEMARALGADDVIDPAEVTPEAMAASLRQRPPTLVVETVGGSAETLQAGYAAVAPGGRVVVLGVFFDPIPVEPLVLLRKEVSLVWSLCYVRHSDGGSDFEDAIALLVDHPDVFRTVLTHRRSLDEVVEAFELASDKSHESVKVTVLP